MDEKDDYILSFMPLCQIRGTFDIMTSMLMLYNYVLHLYLSFYIANYVLTNMIYSVPLNIMFSLQKRCEGIPVLKQMQLENLELFWKLDLFCD